MLRKMIAGVQVSLDGYTQGAEGEKDWADSWASSLALVGEVDTFIVGGGMYPGYGVYWEGIAANPEAPAPFSEARPTPAEVAYAKLAEKTPHVIFSRSLANVSWPPHAKVVGDVEALRALKREVGRNIYVVGGATTVGLLMNAGLVDELHLIVHPVALGSGQALFGALRERCAFELASAKALPNGRVHLAYLVATRSTKY